MEEDHPQDALYELSDIIANFATLIWAEIGRQAIEIGIDKINIWTDVRIPYLRSLKAALDGPIEKIEVHEAFGAARTVASEVIRGKNRTLGSVGKIKQYAY